MLAFHLHEDSQLSVFQHGLGQSCRAKYLSTAIVAGAARTAIIQGFERRGEDLEASYRRRNAPKTSQGGQKGSACSHVAFTTCGTRVSGFAESRTWYGSYSTRCARRSAGPTIQGCGDTGDCLDLCYAYHAVLDVGAVSTTFPRERAEEKTSDQDKDA